MLTQITRRNVLLGAVAASLAGCAVKQPIVLDRQAMAGIKRIGLPTVGVAGSPDVRVLNAVSDRMAGFGLIGAIGAMSGMVVRGNRSDSVRRMMAARGFDPGPALTAMLTADLQAKGFTVVPIAADPKRSYLPSVAESPAYDAVLDCYVSIYGYHALDDSDDSPYRTIIGVPARLIGRGNVVLMEDTVAVSAGQTPPGPVPSGSPAPSPAPAGANMNRAGVFTSFSDVEKDPVVAIDAMRAVFETAAAGVVRRIT